MKLHVITPLLLIFCILTNVITSRRPNRTDNARIAGGYYIDIEDAPYQAFIEARNGKKLTVCGGSIISEKCILTAASCLTDVDIIKITIGTAKITPGITPGIKSYYSAIYKIHESFNRTTYDYDVAVIYINGTMALDGVTTKAADLADETTILQADSPLIVTGFGDNDGGDSDYEDDNSRYLMYTEVPILNQGECEEDYSKLITITSRQFCASAENDAGPCPGDYGGPAVNENGLLVGISLVSYKCGGIGKSLYPSIYVNITDSEVRSFIRTYGRV